MNKFFALCGLAALFGGATLTGCSNTAEGAAEDSKNAAATVEKGAERAGAAVEKAAVGAEKAVEGAAQDAAGALNITPKVKEAILADSELNNTANTIDVDSADGKVHLKGEVMSNEMKKKAEEIAKKVISDNGKTDMVSNELVVKAR